MLLTIDIGNTNIVIGLFENERLIKKYRLLSDEKKPVDDYGIDLVEVFLNDKIDISKISGAIIGSVVPKLTEKISDALRKIINGKILTIGDENVNLDIKIEIENEAEIGADRLINSIAAYKKFGGNLIIVDFGTATTFDAVGKNGEYLGGIICPGINLSLKALHDMTAKLPRISIEKQKNVIGKNTVEAMNSGVYFGYISLIEGLIQKIEKELNCATSLVLTGGLADLFKDELKDSSNHYEPDLTLEGLKMIYEKTKP